MSTFDSAHPLRTFLQFQLASDDAAVLNLPHVVQFLSPQHFKPSPHLQKWSTRINSLIHSKDPGARWAGLSIACRTSTLSRELMLENARGWVSAALPLFSKQEPLPTLKAATRLLTHIFSVAIDNPEFQRQIASPNVPKFSLALIAIVEDHPSRELKLLALDALYVLVPLYPTLFKPLHGRLCALCFRQFDCPAGRPTDVPFAQATSRLYSVLPVTGGKVGAASLWRKSVDEILSIGWRSLSAVRSSVPANVTPPKQYQPFQEDATVSIPLNLDRLRCAVLALCDLLTYICSPSGLPLQEPFQLPLGALVSFNQALLSRTHDNVKENSHVETSVRAMETAVVPEICALGCDLLSRLATCAERHLTPHSGRFTSIILFHLELAPPPDRHVEFLRALVSLLANAHTMHSQLLLNRIVRVLLSTLSVLLPTQSDISNDRESTVSSKGRRGRKRAHDYEGDEIFGITTNVICPTATHKTMTLTTLDALRLILQNPYLPPATYSLISRLLLGLNVWLPSLHPTRLSNDQSFHALLLRGFQGTSIDLSADTRGVIGRSLGLIMHGLQEPIDDPATSTITLRTIDRLLHPRFPWLVRAPPYTELLPLLRTEESVEERELRESLHISVGPPARATGTTGPANQRSMPTLALDSGPLPLPPNPDTLPNVNEPKTPALEPLSSPRYYQAATPDLRPATPPNLHNLSPPVQSPGQGSSDSKDPLRPSQALDVPSSLMSGVASAPESRFGAVLEATNAVDDDDDDNEDMPSIDMGSDSD
ncbi:rRNA processing/ribosome biogenesis-domain-containing protein [Russula earlei]|uniref:rRNA processing/ribosome biogenesis-domain-containing protein n=1 Tax=Russula earlei TaxID=71964 RepID=A0ACC0U5N6_9AGAM|nr:rRNA processing/ribosome biogenesis-domain-containing protein [Russula earlei]